MKTKQLFGWLVLSTVLAAGIYFWQTPSLSAAPNVVFKTIKGETLPMSELHGKPVLVTFWASDCPACLAEIPHLISLHQRFSPLGLTIIAVAMAYDPPNQVLQTAHNQQLPYFVALDPQAELANAFGDVQFTPTSFLIDKEERIIQKTVGLLDISVLEKWLGNQANF